MSEFYKILPQRPNATEHAVFAWEKCACCNNEKTTYISTFSRYVLAAEYIKLLGGKLING